MSNPNETLVGKKARIADGNCGAGYTFTITEAGLGGNGEALVYGHNYGPVRVSDLQIRVVCGRCGGSGRYPSMVYNGICLACHGVGGSWEAPDKTVARAKRRVQAAARKERKAAAKQAAAEQAAESYLAARPELAAALAATGLGAREAEILADLRAKLVRFGSLSDKQIAYAVALAAPPVCGLCGGAHKTDACPNRGEAPVGRVDVEGVVLTVKLQDGNYGATLKCLVLLDNGAKLWGTVPAALSNLERGARVAFTATCERKAGEKSFGFYKRPTGARLVPAAA